MKVKSIWRYPVKSMGGEPLEQTTVGESGVTGDRYYAVHDGKSSCSAKKHARLMRYTVRYKTEPDGTNLPPVTIETGSGALSSDDPALARSLSAELGFNVTLDSLRPKSDIDYYRREDEQQSVDEIRGILGLEEDEPFPDFSEFPASTFEFSTPPGTFFDAYPLLIVTTNSLKRLQQAVPDAVIDERRFRPNIVLDAGEFETDFIEDGWKGRRLKVGDAIVELTVSCPRCVMATVAFQDLEKAPSIMRALVKENHHRLGIYGRVIRPGQIRLNDSAELQAINT